MLDPLGSNSPPDASLSSASAGVARAGRLEISTQILAGLALLGAIAFGLLASLLAGLLIYELVLVLAPRLSTPMTRHAGKIIVVSLLASATILVIGAGIL